MDTGHVARDTYWKCSPRPSHVVWNEKKQCRWNHLDLCGIHHSWWPFGLHEASAEQLAIWSAAWSMWTKCHLLSRFFHLVTNFSHLVSKWHSIWSTFSHLVSRLANVDQMPFAEQIFPFGDQIFPFGQQMESHLVYIFTICSADFPSWSANVWTKCHLLSNSFALRPFADQIW